MNRICYTVWYPGGTHGGCPRFVKPVLHEWNLNENHPDL